MNHYDKLTEAMAEVSDQYLEEAGASRQKKFPWFGAVAASLAAAMLIVLISPLVLMAMFFGGGMGSADPGGVPTEGQMPTQSTPDWFDSLPQAGLLAAPEYPKMVPYPQDPDGRYNSSAYEKWNTALRSQYNQPKNYEAGLNDFFARSIPLFLGNSDENAVCSPLNIYMALAMLAETTGGDSRESVLAALNADSIESLRTQAGHVWNAHYRADGSTSVLLANSLWLNEGYTFNQETADTLAQNHYASIYQGKLGSASMNNALRAWLSVQTLGLLDEDISDVELSPEDALALASTVYFSTRWADEFEPSQNTEGIFHTPAGDVDATFMNRTMYYGPYYYGKDFGAVKLELGQNSFDYTMWLVLPDEGYDPSDILESGHALDMILCTDWLDRTRAEVKVYLSLPKFDISAEADLRDGMTALGMGDLFSEAEADFSGILQHADGAYLGTASHAARVTVDEEGVTAAAYTLMTYVGAPAPPEEEVYFTLDRPFLFVITSHDNLPLFVGVVNEP